MMIWLNPFYKKEPRPTKAELTAEYYRIITQPKYTHGYIIMKKIRIMCLPLLRPNYYLSVWYQSIFYDKSLHKFFGKVTNRVKRRRIYLKEPGAPTYPFSYYEEYYELCPGPYAEKRLAEFCRRLRFSRRLSVATNKDHSKFMFHHPWKSWMASNEYRNLTLTKKLYFDRFINTREWWVMNNPTIGVWRDYEARRLALLKRLDTDVLMEEFDAEVRNFSRDLMLYGLPKLHFLIKWGLVILKAFFFFFLFLLFAYLLVFTLNLLLAAVKHLTVREARSLIFNYLIFYMKSFYLYSVEFFLKLNNFVVNYANSSPFFSKLLFLKDRKYRKYFVLCYVLLILFLL